MLQLAVMGDRAAVNAIAAQVHALHIAWRPDIYCQSNEMYPEKRFQAAVSAQQLYVARLDGNVVGYVVLKICDFNWPGVVRRKVMFVDEFGVHEAYRGKGIGTKMMEDVHALAQASGCTDLQLGVYPQNEGAVRFYESFGFTIRSIDMQKKV